MECLLYMRLTICIWIVIVSMYRNVVCVWFHFVLFDSSFILSFIWNSCYGKSIVLRVAKQHLRKYHLHITPPPLPPVRYSNAPSKHADFQCESKAEKRLSERNAGVFLYVYVLVLFHLLWVCQPIHKWMPIHNAFYSSNSNKCSPYKLHWYGVLSSECHIIMHKHVWYMK